MAPGAILWHAIKYAQPQLQDSQVRQRCKQGQDLDLCLAIQQILLGQADDLGGGVFKKRLNNNQHRSILVAKGGKYWIYEYLFAKKDRGNIESAELLAFRLLAKSYAGLTAHQLDQLLINKDLLEICHDDKTEI